MSQYSQRGKTTGLAASRRTSFALPGTLFGRFRDLFGCVMKVWNGEVMTDLQYASTNGKMTRGLPARPAKARSRRPQSADFEEFFENGAIALHLVGPDGIILHANRAELELFGYPAEEYVGRPITDFHVDSEVIGDILSRLKSGEKLEKYPARLRARNGSIKYVEITSSVYFRDGKFLHTRCFTVDVTEVRRAHEAVRRKDNEMRQVLDALPAAVYTTDSAGKITYYNRAAAELAGREPQLGKDEWCVTFRLFTPDGQELPHHECPMAVALKEHRAVRGVEALAQRPDGTLCPFIPFPTPILDDEGRLIGAVNMLVDISERKEAESNQKVLLAELNHRVKNNMQMLYALLQSAQRETKNPECKGVLADATQRVAAMAAAQELLYTDANSIGFSIPDFLKKVCASARQSFSKDITIEVQSEAGYLSNEVAIPLALILNELLTNAAKHGVNGREGGNILVSLKKIDADMSLSVEDDGPGFEPQQTGRRSSGLGLVNGLARQLRGVFSVEPGSGARCLMRFPATKPQ
jgi:PAS domain S-box-containing protein